MALQGYTILELAREKKVNNRIKREVVQRVEQHNAITPYASSVIKQGNLWYMIPGYNIYPLSDRLFGGCILTDGVNPNGDSVPGFFGMLGSDVNITAQCANDSYSGNNLKRGGYNTTESGAITNGYRHVFDWGTDRGNGTVSSVCLCNPQIGRADFSDTSTRIPADDAYINAVLGSMRRGNEARYQYDNLFRFMDVFDYDKEKGFIINYSNDVITVTECALNTKMFHIDGAYGYVRKTVDHTIPQTVNNFDSNWQTNCISYTGDYIHLIVFTNNAATLTDYAIKVADWTCTVTSHTFTGAKFTAFSRGNARELHGGDGMLIKSGYLYALSDSGKKIVKCNLSDDSDVTIYDNPICSVGGESNWEDSHGCFAQLPNGDFYIFNWNIGARSSYIVYYHNNHFYLSKYYYTDLIRSAFANNYGTLLTIRGVTYSEFFLDSPFPWVSTVNNITPVIKSSDLTMKLTYELTETAN